MRETAKGDKSIKAIKETKKGVRDENMKEIIPS